MCDESKTNDVDLWELYDYLQNEWRGDDTVIPVKFPIHIVEQDERL